MRGHHAMTALKEEPLGTSAASANHLHAARSWMQAGPAMHHAIEHGGYAAVQKKKYSLFQWQFRNNKSPLNFMWHSELSKLSLPQSGNYVAPPLNFCECRCQVNYVGRSHECNLLKLAAGSRKGIYTLCTHGTPKRVRSRK